MYGILRKKDKGKGKKCSGIVLAVPWWSDMTWEADPLLQTMLPIPYNAK
jgi:hypothetical protein